MDQPAGVPQHRDRAAGHGCRMLRGMSFVAVLAALAAAARIALDMTLAWRFGTGPVADAYMYLVSLFSLPGALALTTLTLLLAPMEHRQQDARWRAELLGGVVCLAVLAWPLAALVAHMWLGAEAAGLGEPVREAARLSLLSLSLLVPLGLLGALLTAWMVAGDRQWVSLAEAVAPLVLTGLLLLGSGAALLAWGTVAGMALQVLVLALLLQHASGLPRVRIGWRGEHWQVLARGVGALLAGQALFALVPLVDPLFAAHMQEGVLATLGYANRLVLGVMGLAGLTLQRVGLPLLSRVAAADHFLARRMALRWSALAALAGMLIGFFVALAAEPLVSLLFERGQFGATERESVASLLRLGMLQLPGFLAGMVLVTALAASSAHRILAWAAALGLAVKLAASAVLAPLAGPGGLVIASALMYTATALFTAWAVRPSDAASAAPSPSRES